MKNLTAFFVMLQTLLMANGLHAEDGVAPPPHDQGFGQTLIMIAIALLFFYLILWRPEQRRRKAAELQRNSLKKGDRVTAMGIIGTVVRVQEHTIILKMFDGSKLEFLKAAVTDVVPGSEEDAAKAEKEDKTTTKKVDLSDEG